MHLKDINTLNMEEQKIRIEIAPEYDSEGRKKKDIKIKEKKPRTLKGRIIRSSIFSLILAGLTILDIKGQLKDIPINRVYIFLFAFAFIFLITFFANDSFMRRYKDGRLNLFYFFSSLFMFTIVPFMMFCPILLGAVHAQYPFDSNFLNNTNKSFSLSMGGAVGQSFQSVIVKLYHIGESRPVFWLIVLIAAFIVSIIVSYKSSIRDRYEEMDVDQLLRSLTEKDYNWEPPKNKFEGLFKKSQKTNAQQLKGGINKRK